MYESRRADYVAGSQVGSTEGHKGMFWVPTQGWLGFFRGGDGSAYPHEPHPDSQEALLPSALGPPFKLRWTSTWVNAGQSGPLPSVRGWGAANLPTRQD